MRISFAVKLLSAAAPLALFAGCSSGSAIAPEPTTAQSQVRTLLGRIPVALSPMAMLTVNLNAGHHFRDFNRCPPVGSIVYVSDVANSVINIYKGNFAGQAPCGQLTRGLLYQEGLFVEGSTHDLYVANTFDRDVVVFHRGATSPFKTYTDSTNLYETPLDVTVAKDGTVIATNVQSYYHNVGSISTWHRDGTFVGNFPNATGADDLWVTVQKDATVYFTDTTPALNKGSCPAGACGPFTATGATFTWSGGLRSSDDEDVVLLDPYGAGGGDIFIYEPPNFGSPSSCALGAGLPFSFDINRKQHHLFYADVVNNVAGEVEYPTCTLIGTVPGNPGGSPGGIAKDDPETL